MAFTRPKAAQIDFDVTNITDPLIRLNSGQTGSPTKDVGIVVERGDSTNAAIIYDESADQFVFINTTETGTTSGNVTISSYAGLQANAIVYGSLNDGTTTLTATATELNLLDGVTATTAELNILDGVTATTAELNYVDGVTSAIQTQLDGKLTLSGGTMSGIIAGFESTGIDDNASSTAVTIDSSQNTTFAGDVTVNGGNVTLTDATSARLTLNDTGGTSWAISSAADDLTFGISGVANYLTLNNTSATFAGTLSAGATTVTDQLYINRSSVGSTAVSAADDLVIEKTGDTGVTILSTTAGRYAFGDAADSYNGAVIYDHSADAMTLYVNNADALTIDSSGNVGIGTTSPVAQFESQAASGTLQTRTKVNGSTASDIAELGISTGTRTYLIQSKGSSGDFVIRDSTGAADRITMDTSGNATFAGAVSMGPGDWPTTTIGQSAGRAAVLNDTQGILVVADMGATAGATKAGAIVLGGRNTTGTPNLAYAQIKGAKASGSGTWGSTLALSTQTTGATIVDALTIDQNQNATFAGTISATSGTFTDNTTVQKASTQTYSDTAVFEGFYLTNTNPTINAGVGIIWTLGTDAQAAISASRPSNNNSVLHFQTEQGGTIGTVLELDNSGNATFSGNIIADAATPQILWKVSGTEKGYARISSNTLQINATNDMALRTGGATALTIDSSQNVGIGTSSIANKLDVSGDIGVLAQNEVKFYDSDSSNYTSFRGASSVTSNIVWTLPNADGTDGQVLSTNGGGTLSWADAGGGGGGVFSEIADQSEAEAGTNNTKGMTPLRVKQAVDSYGVITSTDVGTSGANKILKLDESGALPAISGANLTGLPASGGTVDLTASGAITAGKTLILNSDGTVSQVAQTGPTELIGSAYAPFNPTGDNGFIAYNTTADRFIVVGSDRYGSTHGIYATVLELNSSMAITETVAPTQVTGAITVYSVEYSPTHDRVICHYQNSSPYYVGVNTISYSVANGLDIDSITNVNASNQPYGSTTFIHNNDATIASTYGTTTSTTTHKMKFGALTAGSDASLDSIAYGSELNTGVSSGGGTYHYYFTFIEFPVENYLMILKHEYFGATDYRVRLGYGTTSGTGTSTTYSESGEDNWSDTDRFDFQGGPFYSADLNRGIWFDGKHLRTLSMAGGSFAKSALHTVQSAFASYSGHDSCAIPGTNIVVVFAGDAYNSNRLSYWVITVTAGATAATDTFSTDGPHEISTDTVYGNVGAAYSPDVDGFLVRVRLSYGGSKTYGVRVGRSSTNITATNFLGFAENSASDGQTVTVQLPGAIAVPTQGSLTVGTTYYVNADGTIGTSDAGYGKAGRAVSSTQLVVEERA